jgi:hypothetical protein
VRFLLLLLEEERTVLFFLDLVDLATLALRLDFLTFKDEDSLLTRLVGTARPVSGKSRPKANMEHNNSLLATQHLLGYDSLRQGLTAGIAPLTPSPPPKAQCLLGIKFARA